MPQRPTHTTEYVTLRDYIDLQIEVINKALGGMNESTFITRKEFDAFKERIDGDIRSLRESRAEMQGKASQSSVNTAMIISAIGLILAIIGLILRFAGM